MKRTRLPQTLLAALLAFTAAGAALAADQSGGAAPMAMSGAYSVTFHVTLASPLPPGAAILCKARAAPNAPYFQSLSREIFPARAPAGEMLPAGATPAGSTANCTVEIPFSWIANNWIAIHRNAVNGSAEDGITPGRLAGEGPNGAALSYEIGAVSSSGGWAAPVRAEEGIGIAFPPTGGVASLNVAVTF